MTEAGIPNVFVGSKEGTLVAYRMNPGDALSPAGSYELPDLSYFTASRGAEDSEGTCTIFASGRNRLTALKYEAATGTFREVASTSTEGGGTHVHAGDAGAHVLLAHYAENALSCLRYSPASGFGKEQVLFPGSHPHQVRERVGHVYVPCLGSDHIALCEWRGDSPDRQDLVVSDEMPVPCLGGPRHMIFHPQAPVVYALTELTSQICVYDVATSGALLQRKGATLATHEDGKCHTSSDIQVRPDGAFVYAVNRDPSELVQFKVLPDFNLSRMASFPLRGEVRSFAMDPRGAFLQVGSSAGILQAFSVDELTGCLALGPSLTELGSIRHTEIHYLYVS